jgi:hypothetical protein
MGIATVAQENAADSAACLHRLRALVLLAGAMRPGRFAGGIGRPVFQLPVESGLTLLDMWRREAAELAYNGAKVLHPRTLAPLM